MSITGERSRAVRRCLFAGGILLLLVSASLVYLWRVPINPPGFYIDESSIAYNAHTISQTGRDEQGAAWPLFFRAFGEYKNPTLIYLLAGLFKLTGPSIAVARICVASLGLFTGMLLGLLAWKMTRRFAIAGTMAVAAWLTPWLFECSRVVLEVAIYPSVLALFLLATWRASRKTGWAWREIVALAVTLALLTYSSSIGRLLGPLLALGLWLLVSAGGWRGLMGIWLSYGVSLIPMLLFQQHNPGALTTRFVDLTYLARDKPVWDSLGQFLRRYAEDLNPWRWLVTGGTDPRDHLPGIGSMLAVIVLLGLASLLLVLCHHRRDPWWRFVIYGLVVAVVPSALTRDAFSQLRLIAFPVFFLVLAIPAMSWLTATPGTDKNRPITPRLVFAAVATLIVGQGIYFQWLYHRSVPGFWYVFDARFPRKVLAPALATKSKPLYLVDAPGKSGYIQAVWYGALSRVEPERFVRPQPGTTVPPGGVAISTEEACDNCRLLARSLNYIVYAVPPYPELMTEPKGPLDIFRASIVTRNAPSTFKPGEKATVEFLAKNISSIEWPAVGETDGRYAVKLAARWRDNTGSVMSEEPHEKQLPCDVEPGDTVGLLLEITAPTRPGDYSLEVDLFQEGVGWFADRGSQPLELDVRILANP
jgi:hypothetical protein